MVKGLQLSSIYNSRNFKATLNPVSDLDYRLIYNSRNFKATLNLRGDRRPRHIYNSRNFKATLNLLQTMASKESTIVEISKPP